MHELPPRVDVTGADWLAIAIDRGNLRRVRRGHVCHLVVDLDGTLDPAKATALLRASPLGAVAGLRLHRPWFGRPWWDATGAALPVGTHAGVVDAAFLAARDAPLELPVRVDLVATSDTTTSVVLTWNHALLDARGAELLLGAVDGGVPEGGVVAPEPEPEPPMTMERALLAKDGRDAMFRLSWPTFATMGRRPRRGAPEVVRWVFDTAEATRIKARAFELGAGPMTQAFLLAATARSFIACGLLDPGRDILVPVPADMRRRGAWGPAAPNHLRALMYRVTPAELKDLRAATGAIVEQFRGRMRDGWPEIYGALTDLSRWIPLPLYRFVVSAPSLGKIATFGLSWTGEVLPGVETVCGLPLVDARHVPSNPTPPGITVVASTFRGRLDVVLATAPGQVAPQQVEDFAGALRTELLGDPA